MSTNKSACGESNRTIALSASIISFATFCSRLLGFIRDLVIARLFGVYVYAQAFIIALRIPNLLRDLVAEGAANAAFVPVFSEYKTKRTQEEYWELANVVLNLLLVILSLITIIGVIFSPLIVRLIAPGFVADPQKLEITVRLSRLIFPYILLISLTAYSASLLNTLNHFTVPAFAPCLLNISIIIFVLLFKEGILGLALGVLIGGLLQLFIQIPVLFRKGFRLKLFRHFKDPAAKVIGSLMVPRVFSSGIYQLNNFVDSIFGSLAFIVGEGGVAVLYFAYRLIQFPLGIFSNALSQAILPAFSMLAAEENYEKLKKTLSFGMRAVFFILLPASIGFMVFSQQIIKGLFEGGRFDLHSSQLTAGVLFFYSIGLFSYGANKILNSCFFALKDTLTPAKVSFFSLAVNIILNIILMYPMKLNGLALATSLSGITNYFILLFILNKRIGGLHSKELKVSFLKILSASLCMGLVCYFISKNVSISGSLPIRLLILGLIIFAGCLSYIIFCFIFRIREMRDLWQWMVKR